MKALASIIIPVFNKLEYTKACLDSILKDSARPPLEIIVVDNGSTDGTREYLEALDRTMIRTDDLLKPIFNTKNLGVAPAWNQGAREAKTETLAILNNDILVTKGWLRSLMWAMETHKLDLVSPFAATGKMDYDLHTRAEKFTEKNLARLWDDYDFCAFVMPRETFQKIGFFDENFLVGGYEDTDYCYRLRKEKMRYAVTGAAFIHHFGSSTLGDFKKLGDKHVGHNRDYFVKKWGVDPSHAQNTFFARMRRSFRKFKMKWDRM